MMWQSRAISSIVLASKVSRQLTRLDVNNGDSNRNGQMIEGLLASILVTLALIPVIYSYFEGVIGKAKPGWIRVLPVISYYIAPIVPNTVRLK